MKHWIVLSVIALGWAGVSGAVADDTASKKKDQPSLNVKMQQLSQTLSKLLPYMTSDSRYEDPKNRRMIESELKRFSGFAHTLKMPADSLKEGDPTIRLGGGLFEEDAERAYQEFKRGNFRYSRTLLRTLSSYCVACHTRTDTGVKYPAVNLVPNEKTLSRYERGELYAATRQFDRAMEEFDRALSDANFARTRHLEWEKAVQNSLAIAVRVLKDPDQAMKVIDRVIQSPHVPLFMKEDALIWKASVDKWKKEASRKIETEGGAFSEARRLMAEAASVQKYPADRSADVVYLRASAVLHEMLERWPQGSQRNEALFLAGAAYDVMREAGLWSLHELYFEACIRGAPHTELSRGCYARYEQAIYTGYSGSGGVSIPSDVRRKLKTLKDLASDSTKQLN